MTPGLRFADWGSDPMDQRVLIALELHKEKRELEVHLLKKSECEAELIKQVEKEWVSGNDVTFPDTVESKLLSITEETVIPEEIRADNPAKFRQVQNDWAYTIFAEQFWKVFLDELNELKEETRKADSYDRDLFDRTKSFWNRVLEQKKEQNIGQDKIDEIKADVDLIFEKMKALRQSASEERSKEEKEVLAQFEEKFAEVEKLKESNAAAPQIINQLKAIRSDLNASKLRGKSRDKVGSRIDAFFEELSKKKQKAQDGKLNKRISDLEGIIQKLERSIERDRKELDFQERKMNSNQTSDFEAKLRATKKDMLASQLKSKEDKLKDIQATLESLQKRNS